jgi:hypothetical protein
MIKTNSIACSPYINNLSDNHPVPGKHLSCHFVLLKISENIINSLTNIKIPFTNNDKSYYNTVIGTKKNKLDAINTGEYGISRVLNNNICCLYFDNDIIPIVNSKNFNREEFKHVNNDLLKVENSLGRLADNHHNSSMIELLKVHSALEKGIDRSEMSITRQAADNYANIQIEAAKNRLGLEQKISDIGNDIKLSIIKDNNETRNLINSHNNDNIRNDLQSERIIHALHHHHPYHHPHHHPHHHHGGYDNYHHHNYPPFFPILQMGGGAVGVSGGVGQGQSPRN